MCQFPLLQRRLRDHSSLAVACWSDVLYAFLVHTIRYHVSVFYFDFWSPSEKRVFTNRFIQCQLYCPKCSPLLDRQ